MDPVAGPRPARKTLNGVGHGRGVYGKHDERKAAQVLPCAWVIDDRKSFSAARARAVFAICRDPTLSGSEKSVLAACIDHMNPSLQYSCFAAMPTIAQEVGVHVATCWRAIRETDGKHILTRRGKRYRNWGYAATEITIHPKYGENHIANLRSSFDGESNYVADLQKPDRNFAKTTSQKCEHNLLRTNLL